MTRLRFPSAAPWARRGSVPFALGLLGVLAAVGCRPKGVTTPPSGNEWDARVLALEAAVAEDPDDVDAWRDLGHIRWIQLGQPHVAHEILRANAAERGDLASRLALVVMADARLDSPAVVEHATAAVLAAAGVAESAPDRGFADRVAEYSARRLSDVQGDLPGDDARFVEMFDGLLADIDAGRARLSFGALQPLVSLRAAIARRQGEDYARFYDRAGCVQSWAVGPMTGHLGALELPKVDVATPLSTDPDAVLAQLACVVRVWNPASAPGVRRLRSELDVPTDTLHLQLGAEYPSRVYVDGHLIHRTDTTKRYDPARVELTLSVKPGKHLVDVVTTVPTERAWVMMRATDGRARPVRAVAKHSLGAPAGPEPKAVRVKETLRADHPPYQPGHYAPLRALLIVEDALAEGDSNRAEGVLAPLTRAKHFAEGKRMVARFERGDPSRGRTVSAARETKALRAALALDPTLDSARLRMLRMSMQRGEDQQVADALEALPEDRLRSVDGEMLRYQVLQRLDSEHAAQQALARAEAVNPDSCRVLLARRSVARERDDVRTEDEIGAKLERCAGSLGIRARLAERRGDTKGAVALWSEALRRVPDDVDALEALARLSALAGDLPAAQAHLKSILALNPFRVGSHIALADLAASQGDPEAARRHLRRALSQIPHSNVLRRAAATLGVPDDLEAWRADGTKALAEYHESGVDYEGVSEVLILDRSVVRVYENGGQRQIVHIIAHLKKKEALDRYGEIQIPEGAQLLALHTIKPDGTRLEPEVIGGKEGLSLRHLEVGDAVEYEFVVELGPSGPMPGYVDVSTFRFQSLDVPYHRSELQVIHPAAMDIRSDRRNDPPQEVIEERGDVISHLWRARQVERRGVEPGHRPLLDELPNVHVYTAPVLADYLGSVAVQVRESQRTNRDLRAIVRKLGKKEHSERALVTALWRWVVDNVEEQGDLTIPATVTLAGRGGNRMMLLRAMLRYAEIDAELWLARDKFGTKPLPGGHPRFEGFDTAMLAVDLPGATEPLMILTASKVMPPGYLPPGFRGAPAVRLQLQEDEPASGPVTVPGLSTLADSRVWDLSLTVARDGSGAVSGSVNLLGMEAVFWRQALRDIDRDRIEEVFLQAELSWLGGATLDKLTIEGEKDLDAPLVLRFTAQAQDIAIAQDGALVLRAAPMPLNTAARYASLPRRTTGLVVPYAPTQVANLEYTLTDGTFSEVPKTTRVTSSFGEFSRTVEGAAGRPTLGLTVRSTLKPGVIAPEAYPDLAGYARDVDAAEQAVLRAK
ncbi:MAG: tetratricopeptide repeat protein [Myxococcota bacterium]